MLSLSQYRLCSSRGYMASYRKIARKTLPWLPLEGGIDITYRCNNNCVHCCVVEPDTGEVRRSELSTQEWLDIINQARAMGARKWTISGGEPLLREDFEVILGHVSGQSSSYSLNTNGTLITPPIAKQFTENGSVLVSIYGATAEVNDCITRNPGSFDAALRGINYLKEAGVRLVVQLVPMRDNFHQWNEMKTLAQRLSSVWRMGASFLILSASGDPVKNEEIRAQRLTPAQLINLDPPSVPYEERQSKDAACDHTGDPRTYSRCLSHRNTFHVDPRGGLSFCCFIREERLRYDLRKGSFREGWETFIPALARQERPHFFDQTCYGCEIQEGCQRCPGQVYLEHRDAAAPSDYLCRLMKEEHEYRQLWKAHHRRYFQIAGITIEVNSDREITEDTFSRSFDPFRVSGPGDDVIRLEHHFSLPEWDEKMLGSLVYEREPWLIYNKGDVWIYAGYTMDDQIRNIYQLAVFADRYSNVRLFMDSDRRFREGNLNSLALFATDQVWLAQALLWREALYVHSCGLAADGNGLLFVGHSQAGKSTIAKLFADQAELLCDDRNILRLWPDQGWKIHGTWHHGELPRVSSASVPLKGIFFLEQSQENDLIPIDDPMEIKRRLIPCLVRPLVNPQWWEKIWSMVSRIAAGTPAYILRFDKSGEVVPLIRGLYAKTVSKQVVFERTERAL
jgi:MoaA/NifB/PqqE/SkfB family radical SAM enzyme